MNLFAINNYVFFDHAWKAALMDCKIITDDPKVSMMNNSDKEIIYASDIL